MVYLEPKDVLKLRDKSHHSGDSDECADEGSPLSTM